MRLALVRHGSTVVSDEDRFAGSSDVALSERGREEARLLGERLAKTPFDAIYTSPLQRCRETAARLAESHGLEPRPSPALVEIDHGRWEGLTRDEVEARFPEEYAQWTDDPFSFAPEGGTTGAEVVARVLPCLRQLFRDHAGQQILVVSHKATIRLLVAILLGIDPRRYRDALDQRPCALNWLELQDPTRARLLRFNDVSHYAAEAVRSGAEES
jgi:probable phosphoglycerate mutase